MTMMDVFMLLAQGRLEPEERKSWWGQHAEGVKKAVSPGDLLRLKLDRKSTRLNSSHMA